MIQLINIEKTFQTGTRIVPALRNISLTVTTGEFICIMGPSGSGKSTVLNIIGCLDLPTSGTYLLRNRDITTLSDSELSEIRGTFGFVFQNFNLIPALNVYENVELPFLYSGDPASAEVRIPDALQKVGLADRKDHFPNELSGGEMQRAAIARALAVNPKIILADEPTGNLDSETGHAILELFQEFHKQGTTIILVTHDPGVASCAGRILQMKDGVFI